MGYVSGTHSGHKYRYTLILSHEAGLSVKPFQLTTSVFRKEMSVL